MLAKPLMWYKGWAKTPPWGNRRLTANCNKDLMTAAATKGGTSSLSFRGNTFFTKGQVGLEKHFSSHNWVLLVVLFCVILIFLPGSETFKCKWKKSALSHLNILYYHLAFVQCRQCWCVKQNIMFICLSLGPYCPPICLFSCQPSINPPQRIHVSINVRVRRIFLASFFHRSVSHLFPSQPHSASRSTVIPARLCSPS